MGRRAARHPLQGLNRAAKSATRCRAGPAPRSSWCRRSCSSGAAATWSSGSTNPRAPTEPLPAERAPEAPPVIPLPSQRPGAAPAPPPAPGRPGPADDAGGSLQRRAGQSRPDSSGAELKGLSALGILVEDLGAEAASCGLRQDAYPGRRGEGPVRRRAEGPAQTPTRTRISTSGSSRPRRPPARASPGTTPSSTRTQAATLSFGSRPALVQVSLLKTGGGLSRQRGQGTRRGRDEGAHQYVDQFAAQIRDANK